MNKRIKKKKEQQRLAWTIRELVAEAQREEARKQALIRRFVDAYGHNAEAVREAGIAYAASQIVDLLADADEQIRVDAEQGIDQVKMLDDDALAAPDSQPDGVRQLRELMEARLEADVQMVGVRREKARFILLLQKRERADVDAVVVVRKFDAGEHAFDQDALAGTGFPDEADDLVKGRKIKLRDLHAKCIDPAAAAGGKIGAVNVAALNRICRHGCPPPVLFFQYRG